MLPFFKNLPAFTVIIEYYILLKIDILQGRI